MKKNWRTVHMKRWIIILIMCVFLLQPVFAKDQCFESIGTSFETIRIFFGFLGRLTSWIWIILGNFAGVLMTNALIYGEFIGLDVFLWKVWQLSRSIANYALGFLFLYSILKYIFIPSEQTKTPIDMIKKILLSSVAIQASWFLIMAVVDISTIALATVSSFPSQVISSSSIVAETIKTETWKNSLLKVGTIDNEGNNMVIIDAFSDSTDGVEKSYRWRPAKREGELKIDDATLIDSMTPNSNNLGGPFMYLGFTVLNTQNYVVELPVTASNCIDEIVKIFISLILDAGINILYSLALLVLIITLIIRAIYLRIFIAASPIIILLYVTGLLEKNGGLAGKLPIFDLGKVLKLIFQPVMFALWISLMFLFVIMMQSFFNRTYNTSFGNYGNEGMTIKEQSISSNGGSQNGKTNSELRNIGGMVNFYIKEGTKPIKDIILSFIVLVFMRQFIKLAISSKSGIGAIDNINSKIADSLSTIFGSAGIIPTPAGKIGLDQVRNGREGSSPLLNKYIATKQTNMLSQQTEQLNQLQELLGIGDKIIPGLYPAQKIDLKEVIQREKKPSDFPSALSTIKQKNGGLRFNDLRTYILGWIDNQILNEQRRDYNTYWKDIFSSNEILEKIRRIKRDKENDKTGDEYLSKIFEDLETTKDFYKNVLKGGEINGQLPKNYKDLKTTFSEIR